MQNNKTQKTIMTAVGILVVIFVLAGIYFTLSSKPKTYTNEQIKVLAQCLTQKGFSMYGAAWCTHCQDEKAAFGESFKLINYVECPDNQALCNSKGVLAYPTWLSSTTATKLEGFQPLTKLTEVSGCIIP